MENRNEKKIIGILGGMGPYATVDLFLKILDHTPAKKDSDHLHILIDNDPSVPNRRKALTEGGADPTPFLRAMARKLELSGADFLLIACNTAHAFIEEVQASVEIPIISIIEETVKATIEKNPRLKKVGLIAGSGTLKSNTYGKAFSRHGIEVIVPDEKLQLSVLNIIDSVKAKVPGKNLKSDAKKIGCELIKFGAEAIIAGCTEIPLVLAEGDLAVPVIDGNECLAIAAVEYALGNKNLPLLIK